MLNYLKSLISYQQEIIGGYFIFTSNLLTGQNDSLHRFTSNLAGPTGTWVRLAVQHFT